MCVRGLPSSRTCILKTGCMNRQWKALLFIRSISVSQELMEMCFDGWTNCQNSLRAVLVTGLMPMNRQI